ncbi:hypothetical protein DV515_00013969 [Chloebia gouldiae]|uniref:Uncharacterized protein n=1 Tax=Chloebia gouldiae TaxID=44316 RepID=A0A3L8RZB3_CHLGU|nr:hypothetical protein DV515_00013969 [Chloebia gouldiae]
MKGISSLPILILLAYDKFKQLLFRSPRTEFSLEKKQHNFFPHFLAGSSGNESNSICHTGSTNVGECSKI